LADSSFPLAERVALVTGAGTRLGQAIALHLGGLGMNVMVHCRTHREGAEEVARSFAAWPGRAVVEEADLADREASDRLVDSTLVTFGRLDLVVASAAIFEKTPFLTLTDQVWDRILEQNLTAPVRLARRASPALLESGGQLIFITCSSVVAPYPMHLPYVVAKAGLAQAMRALALELGPRVRVNAVAPGTVLPPPDMPPEVTERLAAAAPLRRVGRAEDVAEAVGYLAKSSWVTGQELVVDGGRALARATSDG